MGETHLHGLDPKENLVVVKHITSEFLSFLLFTIDAMVWRECGDYVLVSLSHSYVMSRPVFV